MTVPTRTTRLILPAFLAIPALLLLPCCESNKQWYRSEPEVAITPRTVVPEGFLHTDFEPLANWLRERFEVEYRNMTPSLVFEQMPINDIHYELVNLPPESELFELKSPNISRHEILYRIAKHWGLNMSIELEDGLPKIVRVEGKGDQISEGAIFPEESNAESNIPGGPGF